MSGMRAKGDPQARGGATRPGVVARTRRAKGVAVGTRVGWLGGSGRASASVRHWRASRRTSDPSPAANPPIIQSVSPSHLFQMARKGAGTNSNCDPARVERARVDDRRRTDAEAPPRLRAHRRRSVPRWRECRRRGLARMSFAGGLFQGRGASRWGWEVRRRLVRRHGVSLVHVEQARRRRRLALRVASDRVQLVGPRLVRVFR